MELHKKSELSVGTSSFVIDTALAGDASPSIETTVVGTDGAVVFRTSQDISALKPIFQNGQQVFSRIEAQHHAVIEEIQQGRVAEIRAMASGAARADARQETDALEHAVGLLATGDLEKATATLRAVLETYPNCSEARELLEVAYKASSEARLPVDVALSLRRGVEAFAAGKQRDAIESWKQCLIEEPGNRLLQLLVMMATTWSPERRRSYAREVLSPEGDILKSGRPEERQALLLVAQTVEGVEGAESPSEPAPPARSAPAPSPLESPEPAPQAPASEKPVTDDETRPRAVKDLSSAPPLPPGRRPPARRPTGRAHHPSPWPVAGAGAGLALMLGGLAFWLLSGDTAIPSARLEEATNLVSSGQYPQAIAAYDALLSEFGERSELLLGRGRARLGSGDTERGLADLEQAYEMDPEASAIAEEIADVSYSRGDFPAAIEYYEKAFAHGTGSAEGRYRLAVSLVQAERGDDAVTHLQAAIGQAPTHGEAQFLYGQLLNERGRHAEAEKALRAAEEHVEAGSDFMAQLGVALLEQGKLDEAEEVARSLLRSYPNDARAPSLLGEVYLRRGQYETARAQLIQALRTDPNDPRAQIALGRTWLAIGEARGDVQDLGKARQVLMNARGVHEGRRLFALGLVSLAEGDLEAAQGFLSRSLDEGASPLEVHLALADTKARGGDLVGAAEALQRAAPLASDDPGVSFSLAVLYAQLDENARAAEQFLKTLQGVGLVAPGGEEAGPVVLPRPYVPLPNRFDVNRAIREAYRSVLELSEDDPTGSELKLLAEPTNFVVSSGR